MGGTRGSLFRALVCLLCRRLLLDGTPTRAESSECWAGITGHIPYFCCHPRWGESGNSNCWDSYFNYDLCCNELTWLPHERKQYWGSVVYDLKRRCQHLQRSAPTDAEAPAIDIKTAPREAIIAGDYQHVARLWSKGLDEEMYFWYKFFTEYRFASRFGIEPNHGLIDKFAKALNSSSPLIETMRNVLTQQARRQSRELPSHVRLLDVGSGPVSIIGYKWNGVDVEVQASDALACEYRTILQDLNIAVPPMGLPVSVETEELSQRFGPSMFDVVYCSNALDHVYDPLRSIVQMLQVVKPGGALYLLHSRNEGKRMSYRGLHKWNFDVHAGRLVMWRPLEKKAIYLEDVERYLAELGLVVEGSADARLIDQLEPSDEPHLVEAIIWRPMAGD
eukprot:TRINITY_DN63447_c0_g1_i1.p1 TRINITY_DN63447_c0_g1~~TRINITY_DN63447_c0_g1_i1.p1  ORF type:complete len:391 (-),score=45.47 TRINITY_DN63447_c0_g1_i1:276-1448(-)